MTDNERQINGLKKKLIQNVTIKGSNEVKKKRKRQTEDLNEKEAKLVKLNDEFERAKKKKIEEKSMKEDVATSYTLAIAVPGSYLNNAQNMELRSYMVSQVARAATIFCANEIVIYDETAKMTQEDINAYWAGRWSGDIVPSDSNFESCFYLAKVLEYLECPQYLRKKLFPFHKALRYAGLLNPLDAYHHFKIDDLSFQFREGVVENKPVKSGRGPLVDIGLDKPFQIDEEISLPPDTRVTVEIKNLTDGQKYRKFHGCISSADKVRKATGAYWGYSVRLATSIKDVLNRERYDIILGTSPRGSPVADLNICTLQNMRILIVFGGIQGVDAALESEESLEFFKAEEAFDHLINSLPHKGTRTERVEENVLITLSEVSMRLQQLMS